MQPANSLPNTFSHPAPKNTCSYPNKKKEKRHLIN